MTPSSQELESPGNPGRFNLAWPSILATIKEAVKEAAKEATKEAVKETLKEKVPFR
jgi:hypothetical protein